MSWEKGNRVEQEISRVFESIKEFENEDRVVLGIDGLSRSGKTTFAHAIVEQAKTINVECCLFHIDDFIVERAKRYETGFEEWYEYYELQWPVNSLIDEFFSKLKSAQQLDLPFYHNAKDECRVKTVAIPKQAVILIEGVFLQRAEWRGFFDQVLYLKCPRQVRFLREAKTVQQNTLKIEERYWRAERHYEKIVNPEIQADWVVKCVDRRGGTDNAK